MGLLTMFRGKLLLALLLFPTILGATDYYVDSGCSSVSTYVPATRACVGGASIVKHTITEAFCATGPGDRTLIRGGLTEPATQIYDETIVLSPWSCTQTGNPGAHITWTNYPGEWVKIKPTTGPWIDSAIINLYPLPSAKRSYIDFYADVLGHIVLDGVGAVPQLGLSMMSVESFPYTNSRFDHFTIQRIKTVGVALTGWMIGANDYSSFKYNYIESINWDSGVSLQHHVAYLSSSLDSEFAYNELHGGNGWQIHVNCYQHEICDSGWQIHHNYLAGGSGMGGVVLNTDYATLYNNIIVNACTGSYHPVGCQSALDICSYGNTEYCTGNKALNNTIIGSAGNGIKVWTDEATPGAKGAHDTDLRNNLVYGHGAGYAECTIGGTNTTNSNNMCLGANPYLDANYALTSSSVAAIGQGADLSAIFTTDYMGVTRTVPWDIGAFKYGGSTPPMNLMLLGVGR